MDYSNHSWRRTNAPVASSRTDDIWFHDAKTGWAVNNSGQIVHTDDGGATWTVQARLARHYLRCVGFADGQLGYVGAVSGANRLYRTVDGGQAWTPVATLPPGGPHRVCGLCVVNRDVVYASGSNYPSEPTAVLKTVDGGATWTMIDMAAHATLLVDIFFRSPDEGWVVGGKDVVKHPDREPERGDVVPVVLHTRDGGASWTNVVAPIQDSFPRGEWGWKIQVLDAQTMFVSLENFHDGAILRSDDGGATWRRIPINDRQRNANLEGIGFLTRDIGWVGGWGDFEMQGGNTSATLDGGRIWDDANAVGFRLNRFRFIGSPPTVAYASGDTVYKFTDEPAAAPAVAAVAREGDRDVVLAGVDEVAFDAAVPEGAADLSVEIWERFGRHVRTLVEEAQPQAGARTVRWDFTDADGRAVGPGIYIVRTTAGDRAEGRIVRRLPRG